MTCPCKAKKRKVSKKRPYRATTIFYDLDQMSKAGRKKLAQWLHSRANWVEKHGDLAGPVFRQRLMIG